MNCEEIRKTIDLYLDGEFGLQEKTVIEQHLEECSECRAFTAVQYQLKQDVKAAFTQIKAPFRLELAVQRNMVKSNRQKRSMHIGMAFAAVLILGLMLWIFTPQIFSPKRPQIVQVSPQGQTIPINTHPLSTGQRSNLRPVLSPFVPVNYNP